jgi:1-acyl-sn-glycerol-3-phosphate acyltransferase
MINRVDKRSQLKALQACRDLLAQGAPVLFFPEGARRGVPLAARATGCLLHRHGMPCSAEGRAAMWVVGRGSRRHPQRDVQAGGLQEGRLQRGREGGRGRGASHADRYRCGAAGLGGG